MFLHSVLFLLLLQTSASIYLKTLVQQAQQDLKAGRYAEARQKLGEAVKRAPEDPALWNLIGFAHGQLNELDPAIASFEKVRTLAPRNASAKWNVGN